MFIFIYLFFEERLNKNNNNKYNTRKATNTTKEVIIKRHISTQHRLKNGLCATKKKNKIKINNILVQIKTKFHSKIVFI